MTSSPSPTHPGAGAFCARWTGIVGLLWALASGTALASGRYDVAWQELETAVNRFFDDPRQENADRIVALLPAGKRVNRRVGSFDPEISNRIWIRSGDLEKLVLDGNRAAYHVAIATHAISDGGWSTWLGGVIGDGVALFPRDYLSAVRGRFSRFRLPCHHAADFHMDFEGDRRAVLRDRISALRAVDDPDLVEAKLCALETIEEYATPAERYARAALRAGTWSELSPTDNHWWLLNKLLHALPIESSSDDIWSALHHIRSLCQRAAPGEWEHRAFLFAAEHPLVFYGRFMSGDRGALALQEDVFLEDTIVLHGDPAMDTARSDQVREVLDRIVSEIQGAASEGQSTDAATMHAEFESQILALRHRWEIRRAELLDRRSDFPDHSCYAADDSQAWWLSARFVPQHSSVAKIPVHEISSDWTSASALSDLPLPDRASCRGERLEDHDASFDLSADIDQDGIHDRAIVGVYVDDRGKTGRFVVIVSGRAKHEPLAVFKSATRAGFSALTSSKTEMTWSFCMECDSGCHVEFGRQSLHLDCPDIDW